MRLTRSRTALMVAAAMTISGLVGCAKNDMPRNVPAILTDMESARLAELNLDENAPDSSPRDVVSMITNYSGDGYIIGFQSFFDETQRPPKMSRLVMVKDSGDVRELTFKD